MYLVMSHYKYREDEIDIPVNELEIDKIFLTAEDALAAMKELLPENERDTDNSFHVEENVTVEGKDDKMMTARYRVPGYYFYLSLGGWKYSDIIKCNPENKCYWVKEVPLS